MHQLARTFANDANAQHFTGFKVEDQLLQPGTVAHNLAARAFPVARLANLICNTGLRQLFFAFPNNQDFRNGLEPCGKCGLGDVFVCASASHAAILPCSIDVDARLGKPTTSPTA